ncbi:carbohydrate ABC transporter permease [Occultella gossypii]|uniref:Sugar ABC transporter permease n=1 Tax=Occultella gossypii TaxID=2800820 RepID=A0ABS7SF39_9MICO|nr:sugar ABC transporter permease [Occultella gossypii]MBZ2198964.1 sugar ABC transporter permease [Occultella gossypii]
MSTQTESMKRGPAGLTPAPLGRHASAHLSRHRVAYLYLLPALILVVGVIYAGVGYNGWVSTLDWNGISPTPRSVGLGQYGKALGDPIVWSALWHTGVFAVLTILVQMALGLLMALVLTVPVRFANLYRVLMFVPVVMAPAAVSSAFRAILQPDGQVNAVLDALGLGGLGQAWLADPSLALISLAGINIWQWTGFSFILYQAALSQIDASVVEAAQMDGASPWRLVRSVVVPQLSGTHATLAITGLIGALKTFDLVYLTTGGGPARSTEFLTTYIYEQTVDRFNAGYGAALSMILLVLAMALTIAQMAAYRFGRK